MTHWVRPNPACEHNGGLMMWVRLMGGYHWQHCPLADHRTLGTKYQLAMGGVKGAGWLCMSIGYLPLHGDTWGFEQISTCFMDACSTHTARKGGMCSQTGHLIEVLGQLRISWLNLGFVEQSCVWLRVCACVFCGHITLWCSSFTPGIIDTPVQAEWALTHSRKSTEPLWLTVLRHCNYKLLNLVQHYGQIGDSESEWKYCPDPTVL